MKLQTPLEIPAHSKPFGYADELLLLGSCFSEHIGEQLQYHKFQTTVNPFGILFHPLAIAKVVERALTQTKYTKADVFEHQGLWKSFYAHSRLNALSQAAALSQLNEAQKTLSSALTSANVVIITLGTAWYYRHLETSQAVANCHKLPQQDFEKQLLSVPDIQHSLEQLSQQLFDYNPDLQLIFTVSPVRHLKDGMIENNRSKAHLLAGVHQLVNVENIHYFPAYEIQMDQLRDYRFYASDMIHPSQLAVQYIWERFLDSYAFAKAKPIAKEVASIQKALAHQPFDSQSEAYRQHLAQLKVRITQLQQKHPHMQF